MSSEPSPPVPPLPRPMPRMGYGVCWSDITDEIAREVRDRELQDNIETPEAA